MTVSKSSSLSGAAPRNGERLRLGLTGLGAIFLVVMIVAAGLKPASPAVESVRQGESLAVLGVAPGAGPTLSLPASRPGPIAISATAPPATGRTAD